MSSTFVVDYPKNKKNYIGLCNFLHSYIHLIFPYSFLRFRIIQDCARGNGCQRRTR